jgi:hypothetical protein
LAAVISTRNGLLSNKQRRSFEDLVDKYAPGNHPGSVLKELSRRGQIEVAEQDIVRFKSATSMTGGATATNVARAARRMKRLGDTLFQTIMDRGAPRLYAETKTIALNAKQLALIRRVLERRATIFLAAIESEFRARSLSGLNGDTKRIAVSVFSWEDE